MNTLNRVLVLLVAAKTFVICLVFALAIAPTGILGGLSATAANLSATLDQLRFSEMRWVLGFFVALAGFVVLVLFFILELRRPTAKMARVGAIDGGEVEISLKTVREHIIFEVDKLPGVLRARPEVRARKGGVEVDLQVDVASDADVPPQATRLVDMVRRVVVEKMGVQLARPPRVRMHAVPIPAAIPRPVTAPRLGAIRPAQPLSAGEKTPPQPPQVE
jgi:hypothetical protein